MQLRSELPTKVRTRKQVNLMQLGCVRSSKVRPVILNYDGTKHSSACASDCTLGDLLCSHISSGCRNLIESHVDVMWKLKNCCCLNIFSGSYQRLVLCWLLSWLALSWCYFCCTMHRRLTEPFLCFVFMMFLFLNCIKYHDWPFGTLWACSGCARICH